MHRRASLLIFVFVSRARGHREAFPHVKVRTSRPSRPAAVCATRSGPPHDRRTRYVQYTLSYGLNADGLARWSPTG